MTLVTGDQLRLVARLFGRGSSLSGSTDLDVDAVTQTLPIVPEIVRRSLTEANSGGWNEGLLLNEHTDAQTLTSSIDPYAPGDNAVAPYPALVPLGFDVWIMGVAAVRVDSAGTGAYSSAVLAINPGAAVQSWGEDDSGDAVAGGPRIILARFDGGLDVNLVGINPPLLTEAGEVFVPLRMRIPRQGSTLEWISDSVATCSLRAHIILGLFPESLGQDVMD